MMAVDIVHPRVAGTDVHKKVIWVAVRLPGSEPGGRRVLVKSFRAFWRQLRAMAGWLAGLGVTGAAMESAGVYWWPVHHALAQAGQIEVCVASAAHMRNGPGRKTGIRDCQQIAELHEHGLLRPSFIPAAEVAALRQRTRYRKKLIEQRAPEGQRRAKALEDAGIKTDSVAPELLGVSGRAMIEALAAGQRDPQRLAAPAKGRLRAKLAAWAGLAPGGSESAGKRKKAAARQGNQHLRVAMVEAAWAVSRPATRPGVRFRRLAYRFGRLNLKKAAVAVAHTLLPIAWAVMTRGADYTDAGAGYYDRRDQRNRDHLARHHEHALIRLGYQVTLIASGGGHPPSTPAPSPA